jgi:C1A family cysteine protease
MGKRIYNLKRSKQDVRDYKISFEVPKNLPKSVDLRDNCPPVFDQGQLGSCSANAGVANKMILDGIATPLSRLFLYYKEREMEGTIAEDAGASMRDICKALNKFGVCEEAFMPYDISKFADSPSNEALANASKYTIKSYSSLSNLGAVKAFLATQQKPVLLGMEVYESFESAKVAKSGKLPIPKEGEQMLGGHAVLAVGYKDTPTSKTSKGYLIVRNSWGAEWGQEGYFQMPYEYILAGHAFDFWTIA